ncbi:MAG: J domain-containing protein [Aureliella sp.]
MQAMSQDYYEVLGVQRSASQDDIQKAYRNLARRYHPDMNPDDKSAQKKFKDIQQAYSVLGEPEKRQMYDRHGPDFERAGAHPFQGGGGSPFGGGGFQFDGDFSDLFRQFTGGGGGGGRGPQSPPANGQDLSAELTIPFSTAVLGGEASISVQRSGKHESIQVKIPAGVDTGKKIRLRGQGEESRRGGKPGDLLVALTVAPHPCFRRTGKNLEIRLPITMKEAVLGGSVELPTPGGTVTLKIPAGSSGGQRMRVKGQGVQTKPTPGDLYVELQIKLPPQLRESDAVSPELQTALEELDGLYASPVRESIQW